MSPLDKCSLPNKDNLMERNYMHFSRKLKPFCEFFPAFSKSRLNFEHFPKKGDAHSLIICETTACEKGG